MSWGKFLVGALVLFIVFWLLLFFGYGNLVLADSVVPVEGMEVDEWLAGFRMCGGISGILGFICAAIWFYIGDGFAGESGISVKYYGLLIVSFVHHSCHQYHGYQCHLQTRYLPVHLEKVPKNLDQSSLAS